MIRKKPTGNKQVAGYLIKPLTRESVLKVLGNEELL